MKGGSVARLAVVGLVLTAQTEAVVAAPPLEAPYHLDPTPVTPPWSTGVVQNLPLPLACTRTAGATPILSPLERRLLESQGTVVVFQPCDFVRTPCSWPPTEGGTRFAPRPERQDGCGVTDERNPSLLFMEDPR